MASRQKRKLSNVKLTKDLHVPYTGWWVILFILMILLVDWLAYQLHVVNARQLASSGPGLAHLEFARDFAVTGGLLVVTAVLVLATVTLAVFTAHRIAGPYLGLRRTVNAVKDGDLGARVRFRKYDHLSELQTDFNGMLDILQQRIEGKEDP